MAASPYLAALLAVLFPLGVNALIRRALAAPRIREGDTPGKLGLPWRQVSFATANGKQLGAWLIPAAPHAPSLILLHGWGGNAEMMLPLAGPLHQAGYTLLLIDARNHGMSDGDSFSSLPRFAEDLDHAIAWLKRQPGTDPGRIGLMGHSVGAAAALLAASRRQDLAAVVSLASFAHPRTMMRRWLAAKGIPYWPLGWYILRYVERTIGHRFDAIAPCHAIGRIQCPVLLVHGSDDPTVPVAEARLIHAGGTQGKVQLVVLPGGHDDYRDIFPCLDQVVHFLNGAYAYPPRRPFTGMPQS